MLAGADTATTEMHTERTMIDTTIVERVRAHYEKSSQPLLLSNFGKALRVEGIWPIEGEDRNLSSVIESISPRVKIFRDPQASAYVVIVPDGKEDIAESAIRMRKDRFFLLGLPRSVVVAFLKKTIGKDKIFVRTKAPFRYVVAETVDDPEFVPVEEKYKIDDVYMESVGDLDELVLRRLAENIKAWADEKSVPLEAFYQRDRPPEGSSFEKEPATEPLPIGLTALERLQAAQSSDVAGKMVIPLDIALLLSRIK